jgi:hypothetical protein
MPVLIFEVLERIAQVPTQNYIQITFDHFRLLLLRGASRPETGSHT